VARLAPAVDEWLGLGVAPERIVEVLGADLPPEGVLRSPGRLLGWRLANGKPLGAAALPRQRVVPMQSCEGCQRGFRAERPGHCRDCVTAAATPAAAA